jgi:transcriptional regulator with XRE-family HTH domain
VKAKNTQLKEFREALGLTQVKLGEALGYSGALIKSVEIGQRAMTAELRMRLKLFSALHSNNPVSAQSAAQEFIDDATRRASETVKKFSDFLTRRRNQTDGRF